MDFSFGPEHWNLSPKKKKRSGRKKKKKKALLLQTLEKTGDNRSKAVRLLNVSRTALYEKLKKYQIIDWPENNPEQAGFTKV